MPLGGRAMNNSLRKKLLVCAFAASIAALSAAASDIRTIDGKVYKDAKIAEVNPAGLVVMNTDGVFQVAFPDLPEELQKKYKYDPKSANKYLAAREKAEKEWIRHFIEEQRAFAKSGDSGKDAEESKPEDGDVQDEAAADGTVAPPFYDVPESDAGASVVSIGFYGGWGWGYGYPFYGNGCWNRWGWNRRCGPWGPGHPCHGRGYGHGIGRSPNWNYGVGVLNGPGGRCGPGLFGGGVFR